MPCTRIISDIHLGSRHCRAEDFSRFMDALPADVRLVLNGDILDYWRPLPPAHADALDKIMAEARRGREVVWIAGNNDQGFRPPDSEAIRFVDELTLDEGLRVHVLHGDGFDRLMHGNILCTWPFKVMHALRQMAGRPSMHVAQYARRWRLLFDWLKDRIVRNALIYAEKNGYDAIVCGHTHFPEECHRHGVRYLNPGCWTEEDHYCVEIADGQIEMIKV